MPCKLSKANLSSWDLKTEQNGISLLFAKLDLHSYLKGSKEQFICHTTKVEKKTTKLPKLKAKPKAC